LTRDEAQFIQDQIVTTQPKSLLARVIVLPSAEVEYPWEHPALARFASEHREALHHAKLLSGLTYGAAILYNLMLAEAQQSAALVDARRNDAKEWLQSLDRSALASWSLDWVGPLAVMHQQLVSPHTLYFCDRWLDLVRSSGGSLFDDSTGE
jgi:hypothetical protein